jgi:hypothetical protein
MENSSIVLSSLENKTAEIIKTVPQLVIVKSSPTTN